MFTSNIVTQHVRHGTYPLTIPPFHIVVVSMTVVRHTCPTGRGRDVKQTQPSLFLLGSRRSTTELSWENCAFSPHTLSFHGAPIAIQSETLVGAVDMSVAVNNSPRSRG